MLKSFEIDWDNPSDIKKHISLFQMRRKKLLRSYGYEEIKFNGSKYNYDHVMPILEKMYETNFSSLYEDWDERRIYYVYAHCNPLKRLDVQHDLKHLFLGSKFPNLKCVPFYIGKGTGNRFQDTNRNDSHRKIKQQIIKLKHEVDCQILLDKLTEAEALAYESKLIDILGLKVFHTDNLLCNLDEGTNADVRRRAYDDENIMKLLKKNGYKMERN